MWSQITVSRKTFFCLRLTCSLLLSSRGRWGHYGVGREVQLQHGLVQPLRQDHHPGVQGDGGTHVSEARTLHAQVHSEICERVLLVTYHWCQKILIEYRAAAVWCFVFFQFPAPTIQASVYFTQVPDAVLRENRNWSGVCSQDHKAPTCQEV